MLRSTLHAFSLQAYTAISCTLGSAADWFDSHDLNIPFEVVSKHDEELFRFRDQNRSPIILTQSHNRKSIQPKDPVTTDASRLIAAALRDGALQWRRKSLQALAATIQLKQKVDIGFIQRSLRRLYLPFTSSALSLAGQTHYQINRDILFLSGADVYIGKSNKPALQSMLREMGLLRDEALMQFDAKFNF